MDVDINWLSVIGTTLDTASELFSLIRGTGMDSDLVPLAAIMLFAGGLLFWFFVLVMVLTGIYRGVVRVSLWFWDMIPSRSGGSMPQHD